MPRVIVVGAGFYGLIAAKTYLQVTGAYKKTNKNNHDYENDLLIVDSASDLGGTWAQERLYPNLRSQNSYGHYEYSDLPIVTAVPDIEGQDYDQQFIPGWKLNRYLHIWCKKWDLLKRIKLNQKVIRISRLPSRQWKLEIVVTAAESPEYITLLCDKLIIATGLSSEPNIPKITRPSETVVPEIHAKDIGAYFREKWGYQLIKASEKDSSNDAKPVPIPRSVAIYGGAKSSFDFVHLFGSLHQNDSCLHQGMQRPDPVEVHWIIRKEGYGPAWMCAPTTQLLGGKSLASDQAASTRLVGIVSRYVYENPTRIIWAPSAAVSTWIPRVEGSWMRRILHGNMLGRFLIRQFWKGVDRDILDSVKYDSQPKMERLRPAASVMECTTPGGIINHPDLWNIIRGPNVHTYRSSIVGYSGTPSNPIIVLEDGTEIPKVDLIVHATGWKSTIPIQFEPQDLCSQLGVPQHSLSQFGCGGHADKQWVDLEQKTEDSMRRAFDPGVFSSRGPREKISWRLFRRIASPSLIEEGDRSFAVLGVVLSGAVAAVAEVQALWVAAFLTGGLDCNLDEQGLCKSPLSETPESIRRTVAEDVVWGRLTGAGLNLDAIKYNDVLMRDLGLNPYRMGGWWWRELTAVYGPSSYGGIVEEWMSLRGNEP